MLVFVSLIISLISATSVTIVEPVDGETYDGDWLPFRSIVENENELPDSVHYSLNGAPVVQIPRLNTDWPTYMQNYQNHGYSESPAPHDNTILWAAPVTGFFHEFPTPVVYDGMVFYTTDSIGHAETDTLFALDAATGSVIWTYDTGYADDAVTVVDGRLYTAADSIFCFDAYSGEKIWASGSGNRWGSTPIVIDDRVFCGGAAEDYEHVCCLNSSDGSLVWSTGSLGALVSCLALSNDLVFVATFGSGVYALDATDGSVLWNNVDKTYYWDSSPVVVDGFVYICAQDGYALAINAETGITEWIATLSGGFDATLAFFQNRLYFANNYDTYYCLDALTGSTIWTAPYCHHGSSGIADGLVFFGETYVAGDSASVVALSIDTGAEVWSYKTASSEGFQGSPSITDGVMYYPCTDGYLYAFGTGLKHTYLDDLYAQIGLNELIVTSFNGGAAVAADTISFTVTGTGINLDASHLLNLSASPNPFVSTASVSFNIPEPGYTTVDIFDLAGRCVTTLLSTELASGSHTIQWDGRDDSGVTVSAGLYLCRIQTGGVAETTGLCLLR